MPPAVAVAALTAAGTIGASTIGGALSSRAQSKAAKLQTDAANKAAQLQTESADKVLAFQREQAARDLAMAERSRRGNYDQWAARERRIGSAGQYLGLGGREIPGYVPLDGAENPAGGMPSSALQSVYDTVRSRGAPTGQSLDQLAAAYTAAGHRVERPMYGGAQSGNELIVDGQKLKFTVGDVGQPNTGWYTWGTDDSPTAGGPSPLRLATASRYLMPQPAIIAPMTPALRMPNPYAPFSAGAYLG